jgi:hypothetical protein
MNMTADLAAREISPALRIVDTTLREGEQFARAHFTSEQRRDLARRLDAFGVDILELPFSKTYRFMPRHKACLVPASPRPVSPAPQSPGQS